MERSHRSLSLHHGTGRRGVHPGFAGARLPGASREAHLPSGLAHRAVVSPGCASAIAITPWASGAVFRDVPHAAPLLRNGYVWLCLSLVPHGGFADGNLARLPARHRAQVAKRKRCGAHCLSCVDAGLQQHQRAFAADRRKTRLLHYFSGHTFRFLAAWIRRLHLRISESESLVVVAAYAHRLHFFCHGVGHCGRHVALHAFHTASRA